MIGYRCDVGEQKRILSEILSKNAILYEILEGAQTAGLTRYYIGAGCICQTVWNFQNGFDLMYGVSDVDFVYYDEDLSYEKEDGIIRRIEEKFSHLPVQVDIKNQARVHLWYKEHYGYDIKPYDSVESAIDTWPTTATAIGVKLIDGEWIVYAPYGLNDMFGQIIRANKTQITKETYLRKCEKWSKKWSGLKIIEW